MTILEQKAALRKEMRAVVLNVSAQERTAAGKSAAALLQRETLFTNSVSVCLFCSIKTEIDTQPLIELCTAHKKAVYVPRVAGDTMEFVPLPLSPDGWQSGAFGIAEPVAAIPSVAPSCMALPILVIVPGRAFSPCGHRIGQGGGYYDRFLHTYRTVPMTTCGLCLSRQLISAVPHEPHDKAVNAILTDTAFIQTAC